MRRPCLIGQPRWVSCSGVHMAADPRSMSHPMLLLHEANAWAEILWTIVGEQMQQPPKRA